MTRRRRGDRIIRVERCKLMEGSTETIRISEREQGLHPWQTVGKFNFAEALELYRKLGDVLSGRKQR